MRKGWPVPTVSKAAPAEADQKSEPPAADAGMGAVFSTWFCFSAQWCWQTWMEAFFLSFWLCGASISRSFCPLGSGLLWVDSSLPLGTVCHCAVSWWVVCWACWVGVLDCGGVVCCVGVCVVWWWWLACLGGLRVGRAVLDCGVLGVVLCSVVWCVVLCGVLVCGVVLLVVVCCVVTWWVVCWIVVLWVCYGLVVWCGVLVCGVVSWWVVCGACCVGLVCFGGVTVLRLAWCGVWCCVVS